MQRRRVARVAKRQADQFRIEIAQRDDLVVINVLGHYDKTVLACVIANGEISGTIKSDELNVCSAWIQILKRRNRPAR